MAILSRDDVLKLAVLAKLELSDEEIEHFRVEMDEILSYVEQLQAVNVDGLEPTSQVTGMTNRVRPDEIKDYGYEPKTLLKNVPAVQDNQIKVRRVL